SRCDSATPTFAGAATASTPRMISIVHADPYSWKTRSRWPAVAGPRVRRRYWWRRRLASTRARVCGATSARPLRTLETVVTDTPTSPAMTAIVVGAAVGAVGAVDAAVDAVVDAVVGAVDAVVGAVVPGSVIETSG